MQPQVEPLEGINEGWYFHCTVTRSKFSLPSPWLTLQVSAWHTHTLLVKAYFSSNSRVDYSSTVKLSSLADSIETIQSNQFATGVA